MKLPFIWNKCILSNMARQNNDKLKSLLESVPPGFLVDTPWLASRNIDRKLAYWYLKRGWLEPVAQGVYRRPTMLDDDKDDRVGWKVAVLSIQQLMRYDIHLGGRTALDVRGFHHYLALGGEKTVYLYGDSPTWLKRLPTNHKFVKRSRSLFGHSLIGVDAEVNLTSRDDTEETPRPSPGRWSLRASSPERAILEMLNELPKNESFHIVDKLFEGLSNLRPDLLEDLLHECTSIKVKRYFFVFVDRHKHEWSKYISTTDINLGSGPRYVFEGGRIHPKFKISVPSDFIAASNRDNEDGP
jgi:hypothetical protein